MLRTVLPDSTTLMRSPHQRSGGFDCEKHLKEEQILGSHQQKEDLGPPGRREMHRVPAFLLVRATARTSRASNLCSGGQG